MFASMLFEQNAFIRLQSILRPLLMNTRPEKVERFGAHEYLGVWQSSYLVDPASSHMLVSKIKPCMSKYKQICTVKLRMAH